MYLLRSLLEFHKKPGVEEVEQYIAGVCWLGCQWKGVCEGVCVCVRVCVCVCVLVCIMCETIIFV